MCLKLGLQIQGCEKKLNLSLYFLYHGITLYIKTALQKYDYYGSPDVLWIRNY